VYKTYTGTTMTGAVLMCQVALKPGDADAKV